METFVKSSFWSAGFSRSILIALKISLLRIITGQQREVPFIGISPTVSYLLANKKPHCCLQLDAVS